MGKIYEALKWASSFLREVIVMKTQENYCCDIIQEWTARNY